jgi:hypothetical protein
MMSQTVIGYTGWQQPNHEVMPEVRTVSAAATVSAEAPKATRVEPVPAAAHGFIESDGVVAVEAGHAKAVNADGIVWRTIPNLGLRGSAVEAFPVTAPTQQPGRGPRLEFPIYLRSTGDVDVQTILSPTLDFRNRGGMRYAISIDESAPVTVNVNGLVSAEDWSKAVADNRWVRTARLHVDRPGSHVVKLWLVDPGLVFQRIQVVRGRLPPSYLGPPESVRR